MEILHHAQIGQNAYTEYTRTIYIYIYTYKYIDKFSFHPQVWGSLTLAPIMLLLQLEFPIHLPSCGLQILYNQISLFGFTHRANLHAQNNACAW